jgi:uncharacterized protein (DUF302 family)
MGMMNTMMTPVLKSMGKEKREKMMMGMMPLMMEGIDMIDFMPRMMEHMLADVTVDDVVAFVKQLLDNEEKLAALAQKVVEANLMAKMMFRVYPSTLGFKETVAALVEAAPGNGWSEPDVRDLTDHYVQAGFIDMTRVKILYFCNPSGGYQILKDDANKPMSVMMPMGVSVYETSDGRVEIAAMNLGMMSGVMPKPIGEVLAEGAANLARTIENVTG